MIGGVIDYLSDPTGMGRYRQGLQQQEDAQRAELARVQGGVDALGQQYTDAGQQIAGSYAPLAGLASLGAGQMAQDYSLTPNAYQFTGQVSDYLDPSIAYQQEQAQRGIESSAAARGNLMSGAAAKAIADRAQQIGAQGYSDAYARMERDRQYGAGQAQQHYLNQVAQQQQRYNQAQNMANLGLQGLAGQTGGIQYGTSGNVSTRLPTTSTTIDPSAGLGNMAAGQMGGQFTSGILGALGKAAAPGLEHKLSTLIDPNWKPRS